jgi:diguanylate cyclase (GGDEF)-like protein
VWLPDVAQDTSLRRGAAAAHAGLHGGFGFPITLGSDVIGVLEFFSREIRQPDQALLEMTKSIGSQAGQFIQRVRAEENLQFVATHDVLTKLPNRYLFSQCLIQALSRAQRNNSMVSVMFLDLDRFKAINDTLGHEAGDEVLREVAARLARCVRKSDVVSRRGGDEFVLLIEDLADRAFLGPTAEKLLAELSRPFMLMERAYQLTASIGISIYPGDGGDADTLLKNADIAMYRAKEQSRNAYRFYAE